MYYLNSYTEAKSIKEACEILKNNENAMIIAGGSDILVKIKDFKITNKDLVGITRINELKGISKINDEIIINAATTFSEIGKNEIIKENIPILAKSASLVGGPQIRNVATIGGNICNAAPSADSAASLFALNAEFIINGIDYERQIPISDFYLGAGKNALKRGEILSKIKIKDYANLSGTYIKFAQRKAMDIATIGVAVMMDYRQNHIKDLRLAYGVAAAVPLRAKSAEKYAIGKDIKDVDEICKIVLNDTNTRDSWRASKVFRDNLIKVLTKRAILELAGFSDEN